MPRVNGLLLVGVLLLVALFRSSSALASAYGIAVTGTMVVTGMMAFVVIWRIWHWSAAGGGGVDSAVPGDRPDVSLGQHAQGHRRRLGAVGARRRHHAGDVYLAARLAASVRENPPARDAARRSGAHAGAQTAAARAGNGGVSHQRSEKRADRAAAQPQALSRCCTRKTSSCPWRPRTRRASSRQSACASSRSARPSCACCCASAIWKRRTFPRRSASRASWGCNSTSCRRHFSCRAGRLRRAPRSGMPRWQDRLFITLGALRQRRHRLFPDTDRPGGRGRYAGHHLEAVWKTIAGFGSCARLATQKPLDFRAPLTKTYG